MTRYGGLLWGEHGKGFRSELVPHHFGPVLYPELQRIKALFDPRNQLNPGKVATPAGGGHALARVDGPTRGALDRYVAREDREAMSTVMHCNGNGQCFDTNTDSIMCPSSKITRDRIHSPKGRASLMREWLRLLSHRGVVASHALKAHGGLPWLAKLWQRFAHRDRAHDFSHQVYDAMSGCLACKACATQCPVRVDVPDFRAQFLELYHRRYARPIGDYFTALLERMLPLMVRLPRVVNALMASAVGRWFTARVVGIADAPLLDPRTAAKRLAHHGIAIASLEDLRRLPKESRAAVVLQDAFTTFYEPAVLEASCLLLRAVGFEPYVLPYFENGKALHIKGFLRSFGRVVARNTELLRSVAVLGFPLVGIEPAVVLTYRDEYPKQLEAGTGFHVSLLQEFLEQHIGDQGLPHRERLRRRRALPFALALHRAGARDARPGTMGARLRSRGSAARDRQDGLLRYVWCVRSRGGSQEGLARHFRLVLEGQDRRGGRPRARSCNRPFVPIASRARPRVHTAPSRTSAPPPPRALTQSPTPPSTTGGGRMPPSPGRPATQTSMPAPKATHLSPAGQSLAVGEQV